MAVETWNLSVNDVVLPKSTPSGLNIVNMPRKDSYLLTSHNGGEWLAIFHRWNIRANKIELIETVTTFEIHLSSFAKSPTPFTIAVIYRSG